MTRHPHVAGVVLAGGRARRLDGRDKAHLMLGDDPADHPLSRILATFEGRFDERVLVAAPGDESAWGRDAGAFRITADRMPDCGPLGGIDAALSVVRSESAFVCGCDMPWLSGPLIDHLIARKRTGRLLVPLHEGRPEPLHAIYPLSCGAEIERALRDGVRMMRDFFQRVAVDYIPEEELRNIPGASRSFMNINTPDDLRRARESRDVGPS
jgi:molybdopterin-guanine dinucleotide biosynthesis protein A